MIAPLCPLVPPAVQYPLLTARMITGRVNFINPAGTCFTIHPPRHSKGLIAFRLMGDGMIANHTACIFLLGYVSPPHLRFVFCGLT